MVRVNYDSVNGFPHGQLCPIDPTDEESEALMAGMFKTLPIVYSTDTF
jgi:hypothetical protein